MEPVTQHSFWIACAHFFLFGVLSDPQVDFFSASQHCFGMSLSVTPCLNKASLLIKYLRTSWWV